MQIEPSMQVREASRRIFLRAGESLIFGVGDRGKEGLVWFRVKEGLGGVKAAGVRPEESASWQPPQTSQMQILKD